jgi:hypothetical protein
MGSQPTPQQKLSQKQITLGILFPVAVSTMLPLCAALLKKWTDLASTHVLPPVPD